MIGTSAFELHIEARVHDPSIRIHLHEIAERPSDPEDLVRASDLEAGAFEVGGEPTREERTARSSARSEGVRRIGHPGR